MTTLAGKPKPVIPPRPENRVEDTAGYMTPDARKALDARLRQWQKDSSHELGVYIGKTSGGVPPAQWCQVALNAWGMGDKGEDDGLLLVIFAEEGRPGRGWWEISLGFGIEEYISDQEATRIIRTIPGPSLDAGDKDKAVNDVVNAILALIPAQ